LRLCVEDFSCSIDPQDNRPMKIAVSINEGPYQHQASDSAYLFCKAALEKGHEIRRVFFYNDGVNNASSLTEPPQDDRNIVARWSKLAEEHKLDLVVCVAAALRRGIRDENLAPGFRISGLGQLVEAGIEADRLVTFGD
jgi:tRNA 2-thiouridine synthesizing protein D